MVWIVLVSAAFVAGVINSVAGGGSFLTFPSLVFAGLPAVEANASNTVALVPGSITAAFSYRGDIQKLNGSNIRSWFVVSLTGGAAGAVLLLVTSDKTFRQIAPWLLLFATLLFAFGSRVSAALRGRLQWSESLMLTVLFPIAVYGGYFGGGIGIMLLSAFRLYGLTDIHAMNGIKSIIASSLNAIAAVIFIVAHRVDWLPTLIMMAAAMAGGYTGPAIARRLPQAAIRATIIVVGALMTSYFFYIAQRSC
jgi:uncharacterized membrane protein YfcA